ncbi:hypothetical protein C5F46_13885 [Phaeovulum veldkampii DSM 11550]|uniref:Uncharacterized protein n=1 Tax=Phaeovulum veldkampii DSM 11550 TaxID=1185920 RepID=A0A2T4JC40_9RHOB|nr:hypothetical protein C5F46_13885 [Phaeovulum veldkampii DSM 11550]
MQGHGLLLSKNGSEGRVRPRQAGHGRGARPAPATGPQAGRAAPAPPPAPAGTGYRGRPDPARPSAPAPCRGTDAQARPAGYRYRPQPW